MRWRKKLESMGYHLSPEEIKEVFHRFKDLADKKKTVTEADLEALGGRRALPAGRGVGTARGAGAQRLQPDADGRGQAARQRDGRRSSSALPIGTGPVDAVYKSINQVVQVENNLVEYLVQAITEGMDANGDVTIRIEVPDSRGYKETAQGRQRRRLFSGRGVDTDIIVASAKAYMQALNKMIDTMNTDEDEAARSAVSDELVIEAGA